MQLELTKITDQPIQQHPVVVLPIIYDIVNQITQLVERRDLTTPAIIMSEANAQLRRFLEQRGVPTAESSLYAAIRDLLSNLSLQIPGQQPLPVGQPMPYMQGNVGPMVVPNQQMPMQQMGPGGPGPQMNLPPDHQQVMNPQVMRQIAGQQMNQGYGMGQMGGPSNE